MGNKTTDKRRRRLWAVLPVAAALMMLLATAPGVGAQEAPGGFSAGTAPEVELDPAEESAGDTLGVCSHAPGEFLVGYTSEEAFRAAPTENVVGAFPEILVHHLAFPEVAGDPASEEAKRQELAAQPGVAYAEYNCMAQVDQAAAPEASPKAASAPPPAICANCGKYVVEKARKILDGESEGKDAYDAALDAARTTDSNVALAFEEDADSGGGNSDTGTRSEEVGSEEASGSEGSSESRESSDSEEDPAGSGEDSASSDTEAESEEEAAGVDTEPVAQRNVLSGGLHEMASSPSVLVLGTGVLLLATGLFVARRTLGK